MLDPGLAQQLLKSYPQFIGHRVRSPPRLIGLFRKEPHGGRLRQRPSLLHTQADTTDSGDEMLPVFSSEEAAREFLSLSSLGEGWCVRGFSGGELVSLIFAFHAGMKGVLLDPYPGVLSGDAMVYLVERDAFMGSVLETRRYPPGVGTRS